MPRVLVFDVNETLLDLRALDPHFERLFGDAAVRREWFTQVLFTAMMETVTGRYTDFGTVGGAALEVVAVRHGVELAVDDREHVLGAMRTLPPHDDVHEALQRLRDSGFRMAALTNSPTETARAQLSNAGLYDYFEEVMSVDLAQRLKPAPEPYLVAAATLRVRPAGMRLVAAHDWDVTGALRAGCYAAYVARPGMTFNPLADRPDIVGPDLLNVAEQIIVVEQT